MAEAKFYGNIKYGKHCSFGAYVIIGFPPKGKNDGDLTTVIGDNALIRSHTIIYAGNIIGDFFQTGHGVFLREENSIGSNVSIGTHTIIEHHVNIEDGVRIHSQAFIPEYTTLKKGCWIGPNVTLTNAKYPLSYNVKETLRGPIIEEGAIIGANATILPGITIGKNAIVGAGWTLQKIVFIVALIWTDIGIIRFGYERWQRTHRR